MNPEPSVSTSEMVERVARALALCSLKRSAAARQEQGQSQWTLDNADALRRYLDGSWSTFTEDARAVIEAMREPATGVVFSDTVKFGGLVSHGSVTVTP